MMPSLRQATKIERNPDTMRVNMNRAIRTKPASANQLDDAGNRIYRSAGRSGMRDPLAPQLGRSHAIDAVAGHGVRRVARMVLGIGLGAAHADGVLSCPAEAGSDVWTPGTDITSRHYGRTKRAASADG
jgi:hypothetical protein